MVSKMAARVVLLSAAIAALIGDAHAASSVLVMRHCVRSPSAAVDGALPQYPDLNDYASKPWPDWGVAPKMCLPRGLEIVKGTGEWYAAHGKLPQPVRAYIDTVQRDQDTGAALLSGLGLPSSAGVITHDPFSSNTDNEACQPLSTEDRAKAVDANFKSHPFTQPDYNNTLARLQAITGLGAAPPLASIGSAVNYSNGYLDGGSSIAGALTEAIMFEWGGGLPIGWGKATGRDVADLLLLHAADRIAGTVVPAVAKVEGASIAYNLVEALSDTSFKGTQFFVGHDTEQWQLAAQLGLQWQPASAGLPNITTLPGGALRFDVDDSKRVTASYLFPATFDNTGGEMAATPVYFSQAEGVSHGTDTVTLDWLTSKVNAAADKNCAHPLPSFERLQRTNPLQA